ncbi:uncharacterized protein LOC135152314 [Daucus carota subsp. sativus]|uniref:uncharacterized protein LOC135152314 n=1 Tax=Daucus carota subsp. sativus TaxID=79200 RepID=UPI003083A1CB
MDMKLVKQGNENSRSSLPHSLVITNLKADAVMEVVNSTTSRDYSKNDACRSSQNLKGHDRVEGEKITNGSSKSSRSESSRGDELKMCRICHLANWENSNSETLIQLGCGCKNELGASHLSCAQFDLYSIGGGVGGNGEVQGTATATRASTIVQDWDLERCTCMFGACL